MMGMKILKSILMGWLNNFIIIILLFLLPFYGQAQENTISSDSPQQYIPVNDKEPKTYIFRGYSISADLLSPARSFFSDYWGLEIGSKLNITNTYFPSFEIGYGICDHKDANTLIRYKTSAPYLKIGLDYNMLKNKSQDNRLFIGIRYGFSNFNFSISGPDIVDPIWKTSEPFSYKKINTTSHWGEVLTGVHVKIWHNIYMGWNIIYKFHIASNNNDISEPYYIPGFGTKVNNSSWGATYNIVFNLNWGKKTDKQIID